MAGALETRVARTPGDVTPGWLAGVLGTGAIAALDIEPIGTGQMSQSHRVTITYEGAAGAPRTVVVKLASEDPTSRATGMNLGAYEREVRFYQELAPRVKGPTARAYLAEIDDEGWFTIVLEDIADGVQGDQIGGCTVEQAHTAMNALAALHAPLYGDATAGAKPWLNGASPLTQALVAQLLPAFLDRYAGSIDDEHARLCERFAESVDGWTADQRAPLGIVHGDYRLDNMLFAAAGTRPLTVVDWQTASWGPMMLDASYFLGGSLTTADRRAHERELLRAYHEAMVASGAGDLGFEDCWEGYRRTCFHGVLMSVVASMIVVRTDRGDEMFTTMLARYAQQALDLDAVELLPAPGAGRPPALRPAPGDEAPHQPGGERLWNESWYFDAVTPGGELGAYVRIGLYPNLGVCWYTAFVCGPDRPSVGVIDFAAPLPGAGSLTLDSDNLRAEHVCDRELERFLVTLEARGERHEDAAAFLRGEPGEACDVALDLTWTTAGEPYAYRLATRYEIPCVVTGTVRVDGEELELSGPGQRDHSWGTRDWWAMDWVWSAVALDDGTRIHAVALRIPDTPALSVGYLQAPGADVLELDAVDAAEHLAADGLIDGARIAVGGDVGALEVTPLAFGPLRLVAEDGRIALFPRAMCRVRSEDGRSGVGWVEWNRNAG
jgi:aminoglycoside phosphotransferase (APT) family kinase protein